VAQYVGIAGGVAKGLKCALYCCFIVLHKLHWFLYKHSISYELKVIRCCHATHYNGISSLLIKQCARYNFQQAESMYLNVISLSCVEYREFSVCIIS
jgi:hypothetical protein